MNETPSSTAGPIPAIDAKSLGILASIVEARASLMVQLNAVQAQFRLAQQAALAAANLDPANYGVTADGTKFFLIRSYRMLPAEK